MNVQASWRSLSLPWRVVAIAALVAFVGGCTDSEPDATSQPTTQATGNPSEVVAACLQGKGWDVTAHPDNSYSVAGLPQDQVSQYEADEEACRSSAGMDQPQPPMTLRQAEEYYDALVEVADCVRDLGYQVDDPPSRRAAVEALMRPTVDLDGWPYGNDNLRGLSPEEYDELFAACPEPALPS